MFFQTFTDFTNPSEGLKTSSVKTPFEAAAF